MVLQCPGAMGAIMGCFGRLGWSSLVLWVILEPAEGRRVGVRME